MRDAGYFSKFLGRLILWLMLLGAKEIQAQNAGNPCIQRKEWNQQFIEAYEAGENAVFFSLAGQLESASQDCGKIEDEDLFYRVAYAMMTLDTGINQKIAQCLQRAEEKADSAGIIRALYVRGLIHVQNGQRLKGKENILIANRWFRKEGKVVLAAKSYANLSILHSGLTQIGLSLEYAREGLAYLQKVEVNSDILTRLEADLKILAANALREGSYFKPARVYLDSAHNLYENLGDTGRMIAIYNQEAGIYLSLDKIDTAVQILERAEALIDSSEPSNYFLFGQLAYTMGNAKYEQEKFEQALNWIRISERFHRLQGLEDDYYQSRALEGHILAKADPEAAIVPLLDVQPYLIKYNRYDYLVSTTKDLAQIYTQNGEVAKALEQWEMYDEFKDSLNSDEKTKALEFARVRYQTEQKESELRTQKLALSQEKELSQVQGKFLWALGIGLTAVFLLGLFTFRAYLLKQRANRTLEEQKLQISKQNDEKTVLLREIHHRVKNNLQVVSNLLELQNRGIDDPQLLEVTREGQSRVRSMALIHQYLYQDDSLSIQFEDFITQLLRETERVFVKELSLKTRIEADPVELDIDTAIPLGLILNELLTNACKYAVGAGQTSIFIWLKDKGDNTYELGVRDEGPGLPEGFNLSRTRSMGLRLVRRLSQQLHGELSYRYTGGAEFVVSFKDGMARKSID